MPAASQIPLRREGRWVDISAQCRLTIVETANELGKRDPILGSSVKPDGHKALNAIPLPGMDSSGIVAALVVPLSPARRGPASS